MTEIFNLYAFVCKVRNERLEGRQEKKGRKENSSDPTCQEEGKSCHKLCSSTGMEGAGGGEVEKSSCCGFEYSEFQHS